MASFRLNFVSIVRACALFGLLSACGSDQPEQSPSLLETYMQDPEAINRGRLLYEGSCANYCHGDEPEPGEDIDLFDCQWQHGGSNEDIFVIVTSGIPGTRMVGFGNNFPEGQNDLWKLIAYLRSEQQSCD